MNTEKESDINTHDGVATKRKLTYGEIVVDTTTIPSDDAKLDRIKQLCADLLDAINGIGKPHQAEQVARLFQITEYEARKLLIAKIQIGR